MSVEGTGDGDFERDFEDVEDSPAEEEPANV
jgi:hypothetical protein